MGSLGIVEFVTLDGVMQGFHGPDPNDPGFAHGGWGVRYADQMQFDAGVAAQPATAAYLFGRRTYEAMITFWPTQPDDNPMAKHLNDTPKYVVSNTIREVSWRNCRLLEGDPVEATRGLKESLDGAVCVLGSGMLVRSLMAADLVDTLTLFVHPLVLGSGTRPFPALEDPVRFELTSSATSTTGVLLLTYAVQR